MWLGSTFCCYNMSLVYANNFVMLFEIDNYVCLWLWISTLKRCQGCVILLPNFSVLISCIVFPHRLHRHHYTFHACHPQPHPSWFSIYCIPLKIYDTFINIYTVKYVFIPYKQVYVRFQSFKVFFSLFSPTFLEMYHILVPVAFFKF